MRDQHRSRALAWGIALLWQVIILATAPLAYRLFWFTSSYFSKSWYAIFVGAILLCAGVLLSLRLLSSSKHRVRFSFWTWCGYALLAALTTLVFIHTPGTAAKIHLLQYSLLAALVFRAITIDVTDPTAILTTVVLCLIGGTCDELLQGLLPKRVGDIADLQVNLEATAIGLGFILLYHRNKIRLAYPTVRSIKWLERSLITAALLLAVFFTFNQDRPLGHRHMNTPVGTFFSVFTQEQLLQEDSRLAQSVADELAAWSQTHHDDILGYMRSQFQQQGANEQQISLFMRIYDHYLFRNSLMDQLDVKQAWIETKVGDSLYHNLISQTPIVWDSRITRKAQSLLRNDLPQPPYHSRFATADSLKAASMETILLAHRDDYLKAVLPSFTRTLKRFYLNYSSDEPFLREMRRHLFRRYHGAIVADYDVAWGENRILETYFGKCLQKTEYAWPKDRKTWLSKMLPRLKRNSYTSIVGKDYIYWLNLKQVWGACVLSILLTLGGGRFLRSRVVDG
jgi:hypothetical protein